jgi:hypothetical protein
MSAYFWLAIWSWVAWLFIAYLFLWGGVRRRMLHNAQAPPEYILAVDAQIAMIIAIMTRITFRSMLATVGDREYQTRSNYAMQHLVLLPTTYLVLTRLMARFVINTAFWTIPGLAFTSICWASLGPAKSKALLARHMSDLVEAFTLLMPAMMPVRP